MPRMTIGSIACYPGEGRRDRECRRAAGRFFLLSSLRTQAVGCHRSDAQEVSVLGSDPSREQAARGRWCVVAAALLWSLSGVITKAIDLGPLPIAFYRSLFAGLALWPLVPRRNWSFLPGLVP